MSVKIGLIMGAWLLFWGAQAFGTTIAFYEDGVIEDGDVYIAVGTYNNATVDMTGGSVTFQLTAYDSSIVNISGGSLEAIICTGSGTVNLSGGSVISGMGVSSSGTANVFGGTLAVLDVGSSNASNLHGGTISDYLRATSTVNVYGYGFEYSPLAGSYGGGQLTGYWSDGTGFSIDLWYSSNPGEGTIDTYSHINLIPFVGAEVQLHPDTLNLASKGKWISCKIWLPEDYNVADVNSETIFLEDEIPAEWLWFNEKQNVITAKFRRSDVEDIIQPGLLELTVTGQLTNGTQFEGIDTIKVIDKPHGRLAR